MEDIQNVQELCCRKDKILVVYITMAFGNPYGDPWSIEIIHEWVDKLAGMHIRIIALSDTIGVSQPDSIRTMFESLVTTYPSIEFGAHFHSTPKTWEEKVHAAYKCGCRRFDGALKGYGGCPMAEYALVGNLPTENLIAYMNSKSIDTGLSMDALHNSMKIASEIFPSPQL